MHAATTSSLILHTLLQAYEYLQAITSHAWTEVTTQAYMQLCVVQLSNLFVALHGHGPKEILDHNATASQSFLPAFNHESPEQIFLTHDPGPDSSCLFS